MAKITVKQGRKIVGFVYQDSTGQHWYAFGRPSQAEYISFACQSVQHGIDQIKNHSR